MIAMRSKIVLHHNNADASKSITDDCEEFTFEDNASGSADSVALTVSNRSGKWMRKFHPKEDDYIKAWIQVENWVQGKENAKLYCGRFAIDELSFSGFPELAQINGISIPIKGRFNVTERNRTWKKTTTKGILSDIAKDAGVKLVYDAEIYSIDKTSQSGSTDMEFAFGLCSDYDIALKLYDNKMVVYDKTAYEKKKAMYTIDKSLLGADGAYSIKEQTRTVYDSVKMQYTKDGKTVTYEYTIPGKKGIRKMFLSEKAESIKDAELKAKAKLRENLRESKSLNLTLLGNIRYRAAENFMLEGFGKLDGKYFIDYVRHSKSNSGYICKITAHPVVTDF